MARKLIILSIVFVMSAGTTFIAGCESDAQKGAGIGVVGGALAGQLIGGNTSATLIGAGVGAAAGYMVGNERDKKKSN
ncbi:MAG: glycine zipper domain-containing protein [Planctomycetota bacterium]|jgi:uncharacterized membrane protein